MIKRWVSSMAAPDFALVIGVVGHRAGGKDTFSEYLSRPEAMPQFATVVFRDAIFADLRRQGIAEPTRSQSQDYSNECKKKFGGGYWAGRALESVSPQEYPLLIMNGIRNPAEIDTLEELMGQRFVLVGVTAPTLLRYQRIINRARNDDGPTVEEFLAVDDRDRGVGEPPEGQQVDRCLARVPFANTYLNSGTLEDLQAWADAFVVRALAKVAVVG